MKTNEKIENLKFIEQYLLDLWIKIGIDKPTNHNEIVEFCYDDIIEAADPEEWHGGDIDIAFRRFLENKNDF